MLTSEDIERMLIEIQTGKPPSLKTDEAAVMRIQLRKECAEIKSRGAAVDVPWEIK